MARRWRQGQQDNAQQIECERLGAEEEAKDADADYGVGAEIIVKRGDTVSKNLCSTVGCNKKARKGGIGLCHLHGPRKRCSYQNCNNFERQGGLCVRHGRWC
jgi:hypothetical protein